MGLGYQERDYEIIDYQLVYFDDVPRAFRGGARFNAHSKNYISCIGAAQTFGCYTPKPYPTLLSECLDLEVLNLGVAGAGPSFFSTKPNLLEMINRGRLAIVQIMSGRSVSNSIFKSKGLEMLENRKTGEKLGAAPSYQKLIESSSSEIIKQVIEETRSNWISDYQQLLERIKIPKLLLWFSVRSPDYFISDYTMLSAIFEQFPQMVNREMIEKIIPHVDEYCEVVTKRGLPQQLFNRFNGRLAEIRMRDDLGGKMKKQNNYYPTPEMHEDVFKELKNILSIKCFD